MASKWDGFSEEDINKIKLHDVNRVDTPLQRDTLISGMPKRSVLATGNRKNSPQKRMPQSLISSVPVCDAVTEIPDEARLSKRKVTSEVVTVKSEMNNQNKVDNNVITPPTTSFDEKASAVKESETQNSTCDQVSSANKKSLVSNLIAPSILQPPPAAIDLNEFQTKQKLMEEQNRLRKSFLAKALEDRKKQTHAEQRRLNMIQEELQKLDHRLSNDVSIIRNQIETASLEFMEAQKRYDRAEKEFLDAKLLLYTKLERKELLTHHLCAIIEQNEMRKAQKLSELMEKLNMPEPVVAPAIKPGKDTSPPDAEKNRKSSSEIILTPAVVGTVSTMGDDSPTNGTAAETSIIAAPLSLQGEMVISK